MATMATASSVQMFTDIVLGKFETLFDKNQSDVELSPLTFF